MITWVVRREQFHVPYNLLRIGYPVLLTVTTLARSQFLFFNACICRLNQTLKSSSLPVYNIVGLLTADFSAHSRFCVRYHLQNPDLRIQKCLTWCWIHIKMFKKALLMTHGPCYRDYDFNRVRRMETGVYLVRVHLHQALLLSQQSFLRNLFTENSENCIKRVGAVRVRVTLFSLIRYSSLTVLIH